MATTKKNTTKYYCHECGCELTDDNSRMANHSVSGRSFLCVDCENAFFSRLEGIEGRYIALFHTAAALDFPLIPLLLDGTDFDTCDEPYPCYINRLTESGEDRLVDKILGFADGVTSLTGLFGKNLSHEDFAARIRQEKENARGTKEQRLKWGTEPLYRSPNPRIPELKMTTEVYNELDRVFESRADALKGQTITPQIEFTLQEVAKNTVIYSHQRRYGEKEANSTWKTIDAMLASESLRKKDEKPIANFTPDAWVTALEKAGVMKDGQFMPLREIEDAVIKMMKGRGYDQTLDAAHQLELNIVNNARRNADQQTIYELPEDMRVEDELGEFAQVESEDEREAKRYAGLTPVRFERTEAQPKPTKPQIKKKAPTAKKKNKEAK